MIHPEAWHWDWRDAPYFVLALLILGLSVPAAILCWAYQAVTREED